MNRKRKRKRKREHDEQRYTTLHEITLCVKKYGRNGLTSVMVHAVGNGHTHTHSINERYIQMCDFLFLFFVLRSIQKQQSIMMDARIQV